MDFPLLSMMLLVPLVGALLTLFLGGKNSKIPFYISVVATAATLGLSVVLLLIGADFLDSFGTFADLKESFVWIESDYLVMNYALSIDGLSILMVFLTALLEFVVVIFSFAEKDRPNYFFTLLLAMEVGLMGVYLAADYFLFYIMWEVTLIPMFFMISWYGGPRRHYSAIKFFIYTHVASLFMLIGIFIMAFSGQTGAVNFSFEAVNSNIGTLATDIQTAVFGLLFFGFIVKMPVVPFHTWLPDAHVEAPTAGSVLLAGVMLKMGSYGIVRVLIDGGFSYDAVVNWQWIMIALGILSMIYGAYACIAQKDLKKMVAYSSISHMGMVLLGIGVLSDIGLEFAIFQMFAHGLITAVLFMVCGLAGHNIGTREIPLLGGMAGKMPLWAFFMMFSFMASLGLPGLVGFVAEFGILYALWEFVAAQGGWYVAMIAFGMLSMMLTAGYYLWSMQRTLFGDLTDKIDLEHVHDISKTEFVAMGIMVVMIAYFGIVPSVATGFIAPFLVGGLF